MNTNVSHTAYNVGISTPTFVTKNLIQTYYKHISKSSREGQSFVTMLWEALYSFERLHKTVKLNETYQFKSRWTFDGAGETAQGSRGQPKMPTYSITNVNNQYILDIVSEG